MSFNFYTLFILGLLAILTSSCASIGPVDPEWPRANWHQDMRYNPDHNNYRGGFTREGWTSSGTVLPHQFNIVSKPYPVRYGTHSERFEIRPTDYDGMESRTQANRSELRQANSSIAARIGEDIWFGWSFYYEDLPSLDPSYGWWPMFGQWKVDIEGAPVVVVRPSGRRMGIYFDELNKGSQCWLFDVQDLRGTWIDLVFNTNFATDENGYLYVWVNGERKCSYNGPIVDSKHSASGLLKPIFKRGYWSGHKSFPSKWLSNHPDEPIPTIVVYYDEWRQGSKREDVDILMIEPIGGPAVD